MTLPARLRLWPTAEELRRMARHPAAYGPTAAEVLTPGPVPKPAVAMEADERRLMDAILADPDADELRLRYAEWVEVSDPERAAFIRDQLANPDREAGGCKHPTSPLEGEVGAGEARTGRGVRHQNTPLPPPPAVSATSPSRGEVGAAGASPHTSSPLDVASRLTKPFLPFGARDVVFRRGFAESMSLTGRSFISLSDGLFAATPLREVRLIAVNFLIPELVKCRNLERLHVLNLNGNRIDQEGIRLLADCPWLEGVAVLM